jgi:predicted MPP superfamily phosphohydrolase
MKKRTSLVLVLAFVLGLWLTGMMPGTARAAESPATEAFRFVQVSDPQLGWGYGYANDVNSLRQAVSHINGLKPDLVVFCGDLVDSFSSTSVADFLQIKSELTVPSYCAPGNHDVGNSPTVSSLERYRQAVGDDYFSFGHKGYTFVIVNTALWKAPLAGETEKQDTWLRQTLAAASDKNSPVFIVGHHPLYLTSPNEGEEYYNLPPATRGELLALFEISGVVAVLGGHRHQLVINEYKGIQLVNSEATSRNTDGRPLGFRLWHVDSPTSIRHEFRPLVPEMPTVDFNGDDVVDCADMCIMVDHWGEDYALCDIAPPPFGDGIVDAQDLIALSEHLFEDYRLTAHWKLDETDGTIASDSVDNNDGVLTGGPLWQPADGQVDGALQFDGVDDYISTPFVLNPAEAPFSVFVWIKGGAPGQVVISQTGIPWGANWLVTGPSDGSLMTELKGTGRWDRPLVSGSIITDDSWHHIGLVWDGSNRTLYVDDVAVTTDTQNDLGSTNGGLYVGADRILDAGSFFSGLIDDVRIYNRAITP